MPSFSAPENLSALQRLAINELERCLSLSERYFQRSFELDAVSFSLRGRSAGQFRAKVGRSTGPDSAKVTFNEIRLNASMLEAYGQRFITETIGHEVAHFIVFQLYGRNVRPHGKEWQSVMSEVLRQKPEVTHQYDTKPARRLKRYEYGCACRGRVHELTSIRHKKVINQQARYLCRHCHSPIAARAEAPTKQIQKNR